MLQFFMKKNNFILLFLIVPFLISSCSGDDNEMPPESPTETEYDYMSVNLNGVTHKSLLSLPKKLGVSIETTMVETYNDEGEKYLWLQGDHIDFKINIRIPQNFWKEGTFTMQEGLFVDNSSCFITFIDEHSEDGFDFNVEGEINITTFDLADKVFKATFSFSSPTNTATGTLDYPLDHEEFN